jgi:flagellar biosynthesis protein FlhF
MSARGSSRRVVAANRIRVFTGSSMPEILTRIRAELGADAVILQARRVKARRWFGARFQAVEITAGVPVARRRAAKSDRVVSATVFQELAELRGLVKRLVERDSTCAAADRTPLQRAEPSGVAELSEHLAAQGLPDALVQAVVTRVRTNLAGRELDWPLVRSEALSLLERMMPVSGPVRLKPHDAARIALVGPTGVGKTTTIAKLAALQKIRHGRSVGFIATDTYRIAAVDQLRRYAELLDGPVRIVRTPGDVSKAVAGLSTCDVIFIDTAGRSRRDEPRLAELKEFVGAARPDEVHLVLSLTAEVSSLFPVIDGFRQLGVNRVVFTKLDEAGRTGGILQAAARVGVPVSYVTTGQEVPSDIELAESATLARLVLEGADAFWRDRLGERNTMRRSA